jgi:hypothetical protein
MTRVAKWNKNAVNHKLTAFTTNRYFGSIPLSGIFDILHSEGLVLLQEDNTEWAGFLCGDSSMDTFGLGFSDTKNGEGMYAPAYNRLAMSWYKMVSGRYEIVAYIS